METIQYFLLLPKHVFLDVAQYIDKINFAAKLYIIVVSHLNIVIDYLNILFYTHFFSLTKQSLIFIKREKEGKRSMTNKN